MKKIIGIIVVIGIVLGLLNFHFILFDNSIKILKKERPTFEDTFVDARGAKKLKLLTNPDLVRAGVKDLFK